MALRPNARIARRPNPAADLGSPRDFGGPPPSPRVSAPPPAPRSPQGGGIGDAGAAPDPDQDGDVDQTQVPPAPEAVNYHDDLHRCDMCEYMGADGNCAVLQMQVQPEGACNAFSAQEQGEGAAPDQGTADEDNDAGYGY
jgi:hypothetical protein